MHRYRNRLLAAAMASGLSLLMVTPLRAFAPEDEVQQRDFTSEQAILALRTGTMDNLGQQLAALRDSKDATHGGYWYLTLYYDGFEQAVQEAESDADLDTLEEHAKAFAAMKPRAPESTIVVAAVALARAFREGTPAGKGVVAASASRQRLEIIRGQLDDAKPVASRDPHWYTLMARIAVAQGWSRPGLIALVTEAASRYPDYAPTYLAVAEALFSDAKTSKEEFDTYAHQIAALTKPAIGMSAYTNIYLHAVQSLYGTQFLKATGAQWPDLKAGMHDITSRLKYSPMHEGYFGMMACVAGDREEAKYFITRSSSNGQTPPDFIWGSTKFFEYCRAWADGKQLPEWPLPADPLPNIYPGSRMLTFDASKRQTTAFEQIAQDRLASEGTVPLWNQDFDLLEALANRYRSKRERTPAGNDKLAKFYDGFGQSVTADLGQEHNDQVLAHADAYLTANPNSPTPVVLKAIIMNKLAWITRGNGFANTVTTYQWRAFAEQIEKTRAFLEDHKAIASQDPEFYVVLLQVAAAQQWPRAQLEAVALEGLAKFPRYQNIEQGIIHFSMPMWGADATVLDEFIQKAVQTVAEAERDEAYAALYRDVGADHYQKGLFTQSNANWERMKRGFRAMIEHYPSNWNRSALAYHACLAGDPAAAKEAWAEIDATGDQSTRPRWDAADYQHCRDLAAGPVKAPPAPDLTIPISQPE